MTATSIHHSVTNGNGNSQILSVPEQVAARIIEVPANTALLAPGLLAPGVESLSYRELDSRATRLAQYLQSLGVDRNVVVGVCLPRSFEMVIAALAVWKAGGAYLPMDPAYPGERLAFMLNDAQAPVLLANSACAQRLGKLSQTVVDPGSFEVNRNNGQRPAVDTNPDDLAYLIYTSGSTGVPKGVEVTHAALSNLVAWHRKAFSVTSADRASHLAGLGFDAAVWELWPYLASGASVHLCDEVTRTSADLLRDWLVSRRITISFVPTPIAERLMACEWPREICLRILLTGGDTLHHYPPSNLPFRLVNNYGPTECTVVATSGPVPANGRPEALPSIGRPIANTEIYLLDERLQPVPPGSSGEIHIGGANLARGYHNRPDLTADKFIRNPFSTNPASRLYKTGDIARLLPDGSLAFVGRVDDQIKIRGYRIEPTEIVSELSRRPDILDGVVMAREDTPGDRRLIAYVVLKPKSSPTHSELNEFLRGSLPEYMLPAAYVRLDALPLTLNGKVDRAALPSPDVSNTLPQEAVVLEGPQTPTEERVVQILTSLLKIEHIGRTDNFFLLGGHSLLGAQLMVRLRDTFGVEISLRSLFQAADIVALSAEIDRRAGTLEPQSRPLLSYAQESNL